jgi:hypothetical protein
MIKDIMFLIIFFMFILYIIFYLLSIALSVTSLLTPNVFNMNSTI